MRIFHVIAEHFVELDALPSILPADGFVWIGSGRREFEVSAADIQSKLQDWGCGQLVDLHISDLLNNQLPSHFDTTSWYDLMVFRRLAAGDGSAKPFVEDEHGTAGPARSAREANDTRPVGFAVFDRLLLSVHPAECAVREFFALRLAQQSRGSESRGQARLACRPRCRMGGWR